MFVSLNTAQNWAACLAVPLGDSAEFPSSAEFTSHRITFIDKKSQAQNGNSVSTGAITGGSAIMGDKCDEYPVRLQQFRVCNALNSLARNWKTLHSKLAGLRAIHPVNTLRGSERMSAQRDAWQCL